MSNKDILRITESSSEDDETSNMPTIPEEVEDSNMEQCEEGTTQIRPSRSESIGGAGSAATSSSARPLLLRRPSAERSNVVESEADPNQRQLESSASIGSSKSGESTSSSSAHPLRTSPQSHCSKFVLLGDDEVPKIRPPSPPPRRNISSDHDEAVAGSSKRKTLKEIGKQYSVDSLKRKSTSDDSEKPSTSKKLMCLPSSSSNSSNSLARSSFCSSKSSSCGSQDWNFRTLPEINFDPPSDSTPEPSPILVNTEFLFAGRLRRSIPQRRLPVLNTRPQHRMNFNELGITRFELQESFRRFEESLDRRNNEIQRRNNERRRPSNENQRLCVDLTSRFRPLRLDSGQSSTSFEESPINPTFGYHSFRLLGYRVPFSTLSTISENSSSTSPPDSAASNNDSVFEFERPPMMETQDRLELRTPPRRLLEAIENLDSIINGDFIARRIYRSEGDTRMPQNASQNFEESKSEPDDGLYEDRYEYLKKAKQIVGGALTRIARTFSPEPRREME